MRTDERTATAAAGVITLKQPALPSSTMGNSTSTSTSTSNPVLTIPGGGRRRPSHHYRSRNEDQKVIYINITNFNGMPRPFNEGRRNKPSGSSVFEGDIIHDLKHVKPTVADVGPPDVVVFASTEPSSQAWWKGSTIKFAMTPPSIPPPRTIPPSTTVAGRTSLATKSSLKTEGGRTTSGHYSSSIPSVMAGGTIPDNEVTMIVDEIVSESTAVAMEMDLDLDLDIVTTPGTPRGNGSLIFIATSPPLFAEIDFSTMALPRFPDTDSQSNTNQSLARSTLLLMKNTTTTASTETIMGEL